ncbi:MAG: nucleotidyltransferase [Clostridiales bacterium]|nr:nucleotidyltransferase [Clostridiales bacterium]MCD8132525.1 nucleotidyltransferase [Clostridiales bacterium]
MQKITLVIMAAGIGSRFGQGIKQLTPVGPGGEIIMDYSIHDALEAGFNKIVFIIRRDLEKDFREIIGNRIEKLCEVEYAFQELDALPEGFTVPEGRTKPWGTGQAVLTCRGLVREPFAVINADDYYGKEGFVKLHDYLTAHASDQYHYCMAGFVLKNTLSDNGGVTRGVCRVDENNYLTDIVETYHIVKCPEGAMIETTRESIDINSHVSMNMWGLTPEFLDVLEGGFREFLTGLTPDDIKAEYLLPSVIDQMLKKGQADVTMLETNDKWFGVTYAADKQSVIQSFAELIESGVYTSPLNAC